MDVAFGIVFNTPRIWIFQEFFFRFVSIDVNASEIFRRYSVRNQAFRHTLLFGVIIVIIAGFQSEPVYRVISLIIRLTLRGRV